jgi:LysM repeat protein
MMIMRVKLLLLMFLSLFFTFYAWSQDFQASKSDATIQDGGKKYYIHTVQKGNTLYNISKVYNVSSNIIEELNPDLKLGLKIGMELKIPFHLPQADDYIYHIVKKKETLYQISKIYNVNIEDIISINDILDGNISEGQYLKIPSMFVQAHQSNLHEAASEKNQQKVDDDKYKVYKVLPKETLFTIGKRYGISVDALMYLNDLDSPRIHEGQALLIPKKLFETEKEDVDTDQFIEHEVKAKETLYGLAKQYAVSMNDIIKNNSIEDQQIQIGQFLKIPRKLNETGYIKHNVLERKDKLSKIAGKYNVSVSDLQAANPSAREKLKKGQSILIPIGYVETDFDVEEEIVEEEEVAEEIIADKTCLKTSTQEKRFQIAILLPLYLDEVDSLMKLDTLELLEHKFDKPFKFIEFYEGALLAAQDLYKSGFDFDLHIYDIPRDGAKASKVLLDPQLQNMDLMISLLYSQSFEVVSDFSLKHQIPLVNVLSKRRKVLYDNPFVFKVEPNENNLYQQTIDYVLDMHKNDNIIIVRSNPYQFAPEYKILEEGIKKQIPYLVSIPNSAVLGSVSKLEMDYPESEVDFRGLMTLELRNQLPGFDFDRLQAFPEDSLVLPNHLKTVTYSLDSLDGIINASTLYRNNLVLAMGNEEVFGIELFTKLNFIKDSIDYEVIGLPYWSEYYGLDVAYTQPMKLKVFSNRFVDYSRPEVKDFVLAFRREYGIEPQTSRYAFLGYDVATYFMSALKDYGKNFMDCLEELDVKLLENQLDFKKIPNAGYENMHWNMLMQQDYQYYLID